MAELKELCALHGLRKTGVKAELVARLFKKRKTSAPTTKFTNETLRAAVELWCSDRAAAIAQHGPIGEWDTSGVTDMRRPFKDKKGASDFNDDISGWDVSSDMT